MQTTVADMLASYLDAVAMELARLLPWVKHFNDTERAEFLAEVSHAYAQSRQTGQTDMLLEVLEDWEATARCVEREEVLSRLQAPAREQDYTPWERIRANVSGETAS